MHHATYVIVEEYMASHYGQPLLSGTSKPDYLPRLLTDEGSIEFTARMSRMLADYRTGSQAPHYSDLNLIESDPTDVLNMEIVMTVVDGRIVYEREDG